MKRSRAPSFVAAAAKGNNSNGINANGTFNGNITSNGVGSGVTVASAPSKGRGCRAPPSCTRSGSFTKDHAEEESQQSLEVDVGMEDFSNSQQGNASAGKSGVGGGRRRSTRSTFGCGSGSGSGTHSRENVGAELRTAAAMANVEANGSCSRGGSGVGAAKPRRGSGGGGGGGGGGARGAGGGGGAAVSKAKKAGAKNAFQGDGGGCGGGIKGAEVVDLKPEKMEEEEEEEERERGGGGGGRGRADVSPPPKKKKKYIRNPETHKVYRARMESELAQARKMLEEGNAAMVDLARDYKRQQAMIEKYRLEDNSLQSFSQLTQSQPTKQQQQLQQQLQGQQQQLQQQLQGQQQQQETQHQQQQEPQHQHQQLHLLKPPPATPLLACREDDGAVGDRAVGDEAVGDGGADGAADAKSSLEGLLECSQGSATFEPEMSQLSQLSQASVASFSLTEATQWMAALHDSQEAWNLDDILSQDLEEEEDEAKSDGSHAEEGDEGPDSVEAVALAAEALSPSRQGISPIRPLPLPPAISSSSSSSSSATAARASRSASLSPMRPPPPLLLTPGGGRAGAGGGGGQSGMSPPRNTPSGGTLQVASLGGGGVVRVGVACLVTNPKMPGRVLIGKRKGPIGAGTLGLPGGHLEVGEEWPTCAAREVLEETGLQVETPTFSWVINSPGMERGLHYVTIFMLSAVSDPDREPTVMEPDKCEGWSWEDWKGLGARKSNRARVGGGGRWPGETLFHPLAILRSTSYSPFRGVL